MPRAKARHSPLVNDVTGMNKFILSCAVLLTMIGCARGQHTSTVFPSLCASEPRYDVGFSNVTVMLTTDMHGGYVSVQLCPKKAYSVDFSKSDLNDIKNRALVEAISRSAVLPGKPIKLVVSGYIRKFDGEEVRDVMMVERINSFALNR